jgi:hypothetical protein
MIFLDMFEMKKRFSFFKKKYMALGGRNSYKSPLKAIVLVYP